MRTLQILLILLLPFMGILTADAQFGFNHPSAMFDYHGNWAVGTAYQANDAVRSPTNGKLYVATAAVTGGADPGASAVPPAPWSSPFDGVLARGPEGTPGTPGTSDKIYFYDSASRPVVSGESYSGGVFTPPTSSLTTIPDPVATVLWGVIFRLDGGGSIYQQLGLWRMSGVPGPKGDPGRNGINGTNGTNGDDSTVAGPAGDDGSNGSSSSYVYRKTVEPELTTAPALSYDGTTLTLPADDNSAWQTSPYISRIYRNYDLQSQNNAPQDIDRDVVAEPNVDYVLDRGGYVYRYGADGTYLSRWQTYSTNTTPIDIDVQGNIVRVLDGAVQGSGLNRFYQVFAYDKGTGNRQISLEFTVPRPTGPAPRAITSNSESIYIITDTSVRRFDLTGNEQTTGVLASLGTNQNPSGVDVNSSYMFILDRDDAKVYTRNSNALSMRWLTREWDLGNPNNNPIGFSIGLTEALVLDQTELKVYVYFNPAQPLWSSPYTREENHPYSVHVEKPVRMEGTLSEGEVIIEGRGVGQDGRNGDYQEWVYARGTAPPRRPNSTDASLVSNRIVVSSTVWATTEPTGTDTLYVSYIRYNFQTSAFTFGEVNSLAGRVGPQGPKGDPSTVAGPKGDSQRTVYGRFADGVTPTSPTGLGFNNGRITGTGSGSDGASWNDDIPPVSGIYTVLWAVPVEINNANNTIHVLDSPYPAGGPRGERGLPGVGTQGVPGPKGDSTRTIWQRFAVAPTTAPTGITYTNGRLDSLGGWSERPNLTGTNPLYAQELEIVLPSTVNTVGTPYLASGLRGERGLPGVGTQGLAGPRGEGQRAVFIRRRPAQGIPRTPDIASFAIDDNGNFTDLIDGTGGNALTWFENPPAAGSVGADDILYAQWLKIDGTTLSLLGTPVDAQGAQGITGGFQVTVYQRNAVPANVRAPINVTYDYRTSTLNIGTWTVAPPTGTDTLYAQVMTVPARSTDLVNVTTNGDPYVASVKGDKGDKGDTGVGTQGVPGPKGDSTRKIWQRFAAPPTSAPTGITYANGRLSNLGSWSERPNLTGTNPLYAQELEIVQPSTVNTVGIPYLSSGERGPKGDMGDASTVPGPAGRFNISYFLWSASQPASPTPGTWDGTIVTGMLAWARSPAATGGTGEFLWKAVIQINPNDNTTSLVTVVQVSGPAGPQGLKGDQGDASTVAGPAGRNADIVIPIFMRSTTIPIIAPTGRGTWNGSNFTPEAGWSETAPSATTTEYVVMLWVSLTRTSPYTVTYLGVPQLSSLMLPTAPVAPPATASYMLTWGLADDANNPVGTAVTSDSFDLAVGESHSTPVVDMPATTTVGDNYYVQVPTGLTLTAVTGSFEGNIIDEWTQVGSTGRWVYTIGRANNVNTMGFTVRRD